MTPSAKTPAESTPVTPEKDTTVKLTNTDSSAAPITELAEGATPKSIKAWIENLEAMYDQKKQRVRKELQDKVLDLISANGYTLEELFGARVLPSTSDLAERARKRDQMPSERKEKMMDSTFRS